ncbi:hypothetical protein ACWIUA_07010 [Ursidibacter sp. B-7004-1]
MKHLIKVGLATLSFILSSCTVMLWGANSAVHSHTYYEQSATDTVRAFGKTQDKNNEELVMVGDSYWYFIDKENTADLLKVLNTKLPKAFATSDNKPFEVRLSDNAKVFDSTFTLYYEPQNDNERNVLKELGFSLFKDNKLYRKHYSLKGKIYRPSKKIDQNYQFETALPISIQVAKTSNSVDPGKLLQNIALTPITLAGDVVLVAITVVLYPLSLLEKKVD